MKNNELTKALLATLLLASSSVMAASDYPAADFQPKVLYSDASADQGKAQVKASPSAAEKSETDANFPAANYQPKVLYSDSEYKHSSAAPSSSSGRSSTGTTAASAAVEVIQSEKEASSNFSYIGLVLLAVAGFFIYNKKAVNTGAKQATEQYVASAGGATGVEKYLEKAGINKTGVAKYLEKQGSNPSTGVAKYVAKQIVRDRAAAAAKATGVEKYLRDNG